MTVNIGENLRRLRLKKELTQEQLAEVFGISPQAVSRWENNAAYPDITMLPGIAIYYNTTIDELIGMDEICKTENINKIHGEVNTLVDNNQIDEAVALLREGLKLRPNNGGLLLALATTLTRKSNGNSDAELVEEAIFLLERALQGDLIMKSKSTATVNLIFLYLKSGRLEKAGELVKSLPHVWESREILAPELYKGYEYADKLKGSIVKCLTLFYRKIKGFPSREYAEAPDYIQLGVRDDENISADEMLDAVREFLTGK